LKVRIKDIARLAQVSPGTVDRVLHNRGGVSEKTRQKIEEIMKEMHFEKDILASSLAMRRSYLFAVILPVCANDSEYWDAPEKGIGKALDEIGHYGVRIKTYRFDQYNKDSFIGKTNELLADKPDAVLLAPIFVKKASEFIESCHQQKIPVALFNNNLEGIDKVSYIGQDGYKSGVLGAKLLSLGMNNYGDILILNIAGRQENQTHLVNRERGFRSFFNEHPDLEFNFHTVDFHQPKKDEFFTKLDKVFKKARIKGIFVTNSRVYKAAEYLEEKNINDVRIVGYDLIPRNIQYLKDDKISFLISQKPEEQGYHGIMTLFRNIFLKKEVEKEQYLSIDILTKENIDYYEYK